MMYFQQVEEIAQGIKTCTQRVQKPGESNLSRRNTIGAVYHANGHIKWRIGETYNVSPGRGKLTVRACFDYDPPMIIYPETREQDRVYASDGMALLKIRIMRIESVRLQSMTKAVAVAEGVKSKAAYRELWESINKSKGSRWEDNPMVWRLWFAVVK